MKLFVVVVAVFAVICGVESASTVDSDSYVAAVVEFAHKPWLGSTSEEKLQRRLNDYVAFINHERAVQVDIMVFPESTLNDRFTAQFVPDVADQIVPCTNATFDNNPIQAISCAARNSSIYVVINLTMKRNYPELRLHNTNVVFDRTGKVISLYRKFNLFGEPGITNTTVADMGSFKTDFGVEFGHFICFDIAFGTPANDLVSRGIRDFAFPTMWFAEIPFLSGAQVQQGWAYAHNVNLLAAGANNAAVGSTGSGIYSGRQGALQSMMTDVEESKMLISSITKDPGQNKHQNYDIPTRVPDVKLKQDYSLDKYIFSPLRIAQFALQEMCSFEHCCTIQYSMELNQEPEPSLAVHYEYFFALYNGSRSYDGIKDGQIKFCAVIACTSVTKNSCGKVFPPESEVFQRYYFRLLEIRGTFRARSRNDSVIMPSTLTSSLMPLPVELFSFVGTDVNGTQQQVQMSLTDTLRVNSFLTFGIYSQEFTSSGRRLIASSLVIFLIAVSLILLYV